MTYTICGTKTKLSKMQNRVHLRTEGKQNHSEQLLFILERATEPLPVKLIYYHDTDVLICLLTLLADDKNRLG